MAITVNVDGAEDYFGSEVLWADEWSNADYTSKEKALTNAENQLYRFYRTYNVSDPNNQIDKKAVYEQALWLLRLDDTIRKAEQGVRSVSVSGISINLDKAATYIAPEAVRIIGRRVGRSAI